ncbi:MAG: tetratricopeptide repeat protein [Pseudomonadota bacterium]
MPALLRRPIAARLRRRGEEAQARQANAAAALSYAAAGAWEPGDRKLALAEGDALRHAGEPEAAARAYQRAIRLAPDEPHPHFMLALARLDSGDRAAALWALRRAQSLAPDDSAIQREIQRLSTETGPMPTQEVRRVFKFPFEEPDLV